MGRRLGWWLAAMAWPLILLSWFLPAPAPRMPAPDTAAVMISEVGWSGTAASSADEWIELANRAATSVDLSGWTLSDADGGLHIALQGVIPPGGYFLLERTDDATVSDIAADLVYAGGLANDGESLTLRDADQQVVDTANGDGDAWPAGSAGPEYASMERATPTAADSDGAWQANDGITRRGLDAAGHPIRGTPRGANSGWQPAGAVDLAVSAHGPATAVAGSVITYGVQLANHGQMTATGVILTDSWPALLTYLADNSGWPVEQSPGRLVWSAGSLGPGAAVTVILSASVAPAVTAVITSWLAAGSPLTESVLANNQTAVVTHIVDNRPVTVLLDAVYYDGYEWGDLDEAVAVHNRGPGVADLGGWRLQDAGGSAAVLPTPLPLSPGQTAWLARDGAAFQRHFGFWPAAVTDGWPGFSNDGDAVRLLDASGRLVDVLVYEAGPASTPGWRGPAVRPYRVSTVFATEGQILYRRRDQRTGQPTADTDGVADWAQYEGDLVNGRKVRFPGWELERFFFTTRVTETATLTVAVAPDNGYAVMVQHIDAAREHIQAEALTFEHLGIVQALIRARQRGVTVTVLLEGGPVGGLPPQEQYVCQQLEAAGGSCWFMVNDAAARIHDRYTYLHAKFILVDGRRALVSSENLSPNSLPDDAKHDGTWGRRGVLLITDAPGVVQHLTRIFTADAAASRHPDLRRWSSDHPLYGPPPAGFVPVTVTGGITYAVRYPVPLVIHGPLAFELVHSPENSLRDVDGLLGLVGRAGAGDTVLVQQLAERWFWGPAQGDGAPNPRLLAYLAAARRGATVRLLLDGALGDTQGPNSNTATCREVNAVSLAEHLDLWCARANPTGMGIHNKMVLVQVSGRGYVHVGSINGTEQASKGNREVALQVQSDAAFDYLAGIFTADWPWRAYLPSIRHAAHQPADHPLISEILYDPPGLDDAEFIELANPTHRPLDLGGYTVSDAIAPEDFEDLRRFPAGTMLAAGGTLVVATAATPFREQYGFNPDFEIVATDAAVPELEDVTHWGDPATWLQLGNAGDEVILRAPGGRVVDAMAYGAGVIPGQVSCAPVPAPDHSLERFPYWRDTDACPADFRAWPFPNPGALP